MINCKDNKMIYTELFVLRQFKKDDVNDMYEWLSDNEVVKEFTFPIHEDINTTKEILKKWINNYNKLDYYNWAIMLKENEKVIGNIGVLNISNIHKRCEIYYAMNRDYWNKGYCTEALKAVIDYLILSVGFNRIEAKCDSQNSASERVINKAGFKYEGLLRQYEIGKDGNYSDWRLYSLLKKDIEY